MDTINRVRFTDPTLKAIGDLIQDQSLLASLAGQVEAASHRLQDAVNELSRLRDLYDAQCKADDPGPDHVLVKLPINTAEFFAYPEYAWSVPELAEVQAGCQKVV